MGANGGMFAIIERTERGLELDELALGPKWSGLSSNGPNVTTWSELLIGEKGGGLH